MQDYNIINSLSSPEYIFPSGHTVIVKRRWVTKWQWLLTRLWSPWDDVGKGSTDKQFRVCSWTRRTQDWRSKVLSSSFFFLPRQPWDLWRCVSVTQSVSWADESVTLDAVSCDNIHILSKLKQLALLGNVGTWKGANTRRWFYVLYGIPNQSYLKPRIPKLPTCLPWRLPRFELN